MPSAMRRTASQAAVVNTVGYGGLSTPASEGRMKRKVTRYFDSSPATTSISNGSMSTNGLYYLFERPPGRSCMLCSDKDHQSAVCPQRRCCQCYASDHLSSKRCDKSNRGKISDLMRQLREESQLVKRAAKMAGSTTTNGKGKVSTGDGEGDRLHETKKQDIFGDGSITLTKAPPVRCYVCGQWGHTCCSNGDMNKEFRTRQPEYCYFCAGGHHNSLCKTIPKARIMGRPVNQPDYLMADTCSKKPRKQSSSSHHIQFSSEDEGSETVKTSCWGHHDLGTALRKAYTADVDIFEDVVGEVENNATTSAAAAMEIEASTSTIVLNGTSEEPTELMVNIDSEINSRASSRSRSSEKLSIKIHSTRSDRRHISRFRNLANQDANRGPVVFNSRNNATHHIPNSLIRSPRRRSLR
eukprot:Filipodium_phascolosomae@DN4011_c0_g1_i1.p1